MEGSEHHDTGTGDEEKQTVYTHSKKPVPLHVVVFLKEHSNKGQDNPGSLYYISILRKYMWKNLE